MGLKRNVHRNSQLQLRCINAQILYFSKGEGILFIRCTKARTTRAFAGRVWLNVRARL